MSVGARTEVTRGGLGLERELQHLNVHDSLGCMLVLGTPNEEGNPLPDDDKEDRVLRCSHLQPRSRCIYV